MSPVIKAIGTDTRCAVHQCVMGVSQVWLCTWTGNSHTYYYLDPWRKRRLVPRRVSFISRLLRWRIPLGVNSNLNFNLLQIKVGIFLIIKTFVFFLQLQTLLNCCCRRKAFLASMTKLVGACQLLALRDQSSAQEVLCLMLEWSLLEQHSADDSQQSIEERNPLPLQVATTLQSTESGRKRYFELCDKQLHLKELVSFSIFCFFFTYLLSWLLSIKRKQKSWSLGELLIVDSETRFDASVSVAKNDAHYGYRFLGSRRPCKARLVSNKIDLSDSSLMHRWA